jgi:hypothetical protein
MSAAGPGHEGNSCDRRVGRSDSTPVCPGLFRGNLTTGPAGGLIVERPASRVAPKPTSVPETGSPLSTDDLLLLVRLLVGRENRSC